MARFDDRATRPYRGPADILRWKVLDRLPGRRPPRDADFAALDAIRPGVRDDGAARLADAIAAERAAACWIGHATWVIRLGGKTVAIDPIWSASIGGVVPRLTPPGLPIDALPALDVVCITHDHRDHMDMATLRRLGPDPLYVVALGNGARLTRLGFPRVIELDWWQVHREGALTIALTPARHWSMRTPWTRNETLWGGFVLRGPEGAAYHAGDTAAGDHFSEIGRRLGPIDWAMLPIGGYDPRWFMSSQHIDPDEAAAGFLDLGARRLLAMHWGTYRLTDEAVGAPPARLRAWWREHGLAEDRLWILDAGQVRELA